MWNVIFKEFSSWGILGIIGFIFIKTTTKLFEQFDKNFQMLFENALDTNKENVDALKLGLDKVSESTQDNIKFQESYLGRMRLEIEKLKSEIFETDARIIQTILDNKKINSKTFSKLSYFIIRTHMYSLIVDLISYIDNSVFISESQVCGFKDESETLFESKKQKIQQDINSLGFNNEVVSVIDKKINTIYAKNWSTYQQKVVSLLNDLEYRDTSYKELKRRAINNVKSLSDELVDFINDYIK